MVRYLTMIVTTVRPEVYPPKAAPEATRVSKDERERQFLAKAPIFVLIVNGGLFC
jgi:hypothetical protein